MSRYKSVWDALMDTPEEAASMKARSEMMMTVALAVEAWKLSQKAAAAKLGVTQPRINDLLRGRIDRFSMEALFDLATKVGLEPAFTTRVKARPRRQSAPIRHRQAHASA